MSSLRIANIYTNEHSVGFHLTRMSTIRWLRMSEALAKLGHRVDMVMNLDPKADYGFRTTLNMVDWAQVRWHDYDVIKLNYHRNIERLTAAGAGDHPFIVCRLGAVVTSAQSDLPASFAGREREFLFQLQRQIGQRARAVTVLTEAERQEWRSLYGPEGDVLVVPAGVDREIPPPGENPFREYSEKIAVYIGNLRGQILTYIPPDGPAVQITAQQHLSIWWQNRLNTLGRSLRKRGVRLCVLGAGATDLLDPAAVTCLPPVDYHTVWDYHYFADVGIALSQGPAQIHECSRIYNYLRSGLPVVSEEPIPTNHLIRSTGLGMIAAHGDDNAIAEMTVEAVHRKWPSHEAAEYMAAHHNWDSRAAIYTPLLETVRRG